MRISDWSSDVCSSDLGQRIGAIFCREASDRGKGIPVARLAVKNGCGDDVAELEVNGTVVAVHSRHSALIRSEEHTSELQSLMRISYAVFCLKKKKITTQEKK